MKDSLLLLSSFVKNPREVGAVMPSSRFLTKEMVKSIDFKSAKNIVELGPGAGTFTRSILENAAQGSRLFCFEINRKFCSHLERTMHDPRMKVINAGADRISASLRKLKAGKADCIVSGLPFRNFSDSKKNKILAEVKKSLADDGAFVLFQYTNGLGKLLGMHFSDVERKFVALNVPPAFVYVCRK